MVISDGIATGRLADGAGRRRRAGLPLRSRAHVHTVWTGAAGLHDVAVARVIADDFAFVRTAVKVEAVARGGATRPTGRDASCR